MPDASSGHVRLLSLAVPWRLALEEGWAAFCAGNPPIGAVVTDGGGAVIAVGRSRRHDNGAPAGQLAGTSLAHAEVNALAQLSPGRYREATLWSSLQPCPLCSAAAMSTGCGRVRFLAADPMWDGAERLPELNEAVAGRWPRFDGPEPGWSAFWQTALSVAYQTANGYGSGTAVTARALIAPAAARLGQTLGSDPAALGRLITLPLRQALDEVGFPPMPG